MDLCEYGCLCVCMGCLGEYVCGGMCIYMCDLKCALAGVLCRWVRLTV